jgi:hypothetical protein
LDRKEAEQTTQWALLGADPPLLAETEKLAALLLELRPDAILPLFDVALGSLAALSDPQKGSFHELLSSVAAQLSGGAYRSYCLSTLAQRRLRPGKAQKRRPIPLIKDAIEITLGVLAYAGHDTLEAAARSFTSGTDELGKRGRTLRLPAPGELDVTALDGALAALLRLPTVTRAEILNSAEKIASADGVLRPSEAELLRTMAVCLGVAACPAFAATIS